MWEELKKLIVQLVMKYVVTALVPMLANPFLGGIAAFILGKLVQMLGEEIALAIRLKKIELEVHNEDSSFKDAKEKLHEELIKPKEEQNQEKIDAASKEFDENFQRLIDMRHNLVRKG